MAALKKILKANGVVTTSNATPSTVVTIGITSGSSITGLGRAISRNQTGGATKTYNIDFWAKNVAGTVTAGSTITNLVSDEATALSAFTASGSNGIFQVTGIAANTIDWFIDLTYIVN